jgi:hypothetical protein
LQRKNPFERLLLIVIIATLLAYIIHLLVRIVNKIKKQIKVTRIKISVGFKQVSRIKDAKKKQMKWPHRDCTTVTSSLIFVLN